MLRVVLTLDCDRCRQSYEKAAVSTDTDSFLWESFANDLKCCAAGDGWRTEIDDYTLCDECWEKEEQEGEPEDVPVEAA
jgi:hypothetical protein